MYSRVCVSYIQIHVGNNGREPTFFFFFLQLSVIVVIGVSDLLVAFRMLSLCCGIGEILYLDNLFCSCAGEVA